MFFEEIDTQFDWSSSLNEIVKYDPCYEYFFHKAYCDHMQAEKIIMLKVTEENNYLIYPFLLFKVPKYLTKEDLYYASSVYGFTGPIINGQKEFIDKAYLLIDKWLKSNKVIAEFIRISPFFLKIIEILKGKNYLLENNRTLSIWDSNLVDNKFNENYYSCNMSRRAVKLGAQFKKITFKNFNDFYEIYNQTMKINKADKFFNYDNNYFDTLLKEEMKSINHLYGVYSKENKLTSAAWFMSNGEFAYYHLGCSNRSIQGSSDLVIREGIKDLVYQGVTNINLTGGRTTSKDDALFKFKKRMGNTVKKFFTAKRTINKKVYIQLINKYLEIHEIQNIKKFIPWD